MGPKKDSPRAVRNAALAKAKAKSTKKAAGSRPAPGLPLLDDTGIVRARQLAEEKAAADAVARQASTATQADRDTAIIDRMAAMEERLTAIHSRPDVDAIQGIRKGNLMPVDESAPAPVIMSPGEIALRKELSDLKDHAISVNTAFMASEERVASLEAKATKRGTKGVPKVTKVATQSKDTLLPDSEDGESSEESDSDEETAQPAKKSLKLGTLSDVLISKIMKANLTRDWTSDVNKCSFKFNKSVYKGNRAAIKLIEARKPSLALEALMGVNQKLGERQRMVLLADNSEAGWLTVKNYEGDDWALSGKDQTKMAKAETKAIKSLESQIAADTVAGGSGPKGGYTKPAYGRVNNSSHKANLSKPAGVVNVQGDTVPNSPPVKKAAAGGPGGKKPKGDCYHCGSGEHWRNECPQFLKDSK
jgi:hypothetical protein